MPGVNEAIKEVFKKIEELAAALNGVMGKEMPPQAASRMQEAAKQFHVFQLWFNDGVTVKRVIDAKAHADARSVIVQP